ncbi:MAG: 5'-nucleotidase C-terminal domain-containing protein [Myxococcales bacterium]|nr:5'-nucleotidase C-terminal domain-containing protein [Myxococcales bacterium]
MPPVLGLIAVNDVYSLEHLPRLATLIAHHRASGKADRWLVVLAGDFVAPSVLSSLDGGKRMVECLNAVGVTHVVFGNHEDDVPVSELSARVREFRGVWLGTNVHGFEPALTPVDVVEVGGRRVGLVGVVMDDPNVYRRPPFGGARLEHPNVVVTREAARLRREERCDTVIAITHQWLKDDRLLAASGVVPLILGGHEHDPHLERTEHAVLSKSGMDAVNAAVVTVTLSSPPKVEVTHEPVAPYADDVVLRSMVDEARAFVERLSGAVLLPNLVSPLSSEGGRSRQTSMGTFVCSSLRDALKADAALFNGGGIRGSETHRDVFTLGDLQNELPFDNEVVLVTLSGALLKDAVAASRRHAPRGDGGFLQVDDRMAVGADGRTVTHVANAPLDEAREYRVAVPRGHLLGLDRIEPFLRLARERPEVIPPSGSGKPPRLILLEAFVRARVAALGGFDALDLDRDGRVTRAELAKALERASGAPPSEATVSLMFATLDANHDQVLSREETLGRKT